MKMELFHQIFPDGRDSAEVRKFISDSGWKDDIEFSNIGYDSIKARWSAVSSTIPCLVDGDKIINGKDAIIAYLKKRQH